MVGKIFKTLIIIVACVILGAMVLNVLLPNVSTSLINTVEGQIYNATGLSMDFNGDGQKGKQNNSSDVQNNNSKSIQNNSKNVDNKGVDGFAGA